MDLDGSQFVQLDGYKIWLYGQGPTRETPASNPAVIIVHGLGGSWKDWELASHMVSKFARVYNYSRGGYVPSDYPSKTPNLPHIAAELKDLLAKAKIPPPYLLVGHSYGGHIVRQYLADFGPETICGMIIKDSPPLRTLDLPERWQTLLGGSAYEDVVLRPRTCLAPEDFQKLYELTVENERPGGIAEEEMKFWSDDTRVLYDRLRGKPALGSRPLSVIYNHTVDDFRMVYEYGEEHQYGTAEDRSALHKVLEKWGEMDEAYGRELLDLSSESRYVDAEGKARTHNSQIVEPGLIVGEIERVYKECLKRL